MGQSGLGTYKTIDSFVEAKLHTLEHNGASFPVLFDLMFSETENVMYERSRGYRIETVTYGQAKDETLRRAASLQKLLAPLPAGTAVGLAMENSLEWIEFFWAILLCGYRPLLLNLRLDDASLERALADCGAGAVITAGRTFSLPCYAPEQAAPGDVPLTPDSFGTEILVMSSGTSSRVKICAYTAEEFAAQIRDSAQIIRRCRQVKRHYKGQLKQLTFLPFYHVFGLIAVYLWFGFFSRTFVQLNDFAPQTILNTIRRHGVTHIFAVPLFWETVYGQAMKTIRGRGEKTVKKFQRGLKICRRLGGVPLLRRAFSRLAFREVRNNLFGESVQFMITGGSFVPSSVLEFFNAVGYPLADGYGMTEIGITSLELSQKAKYREQGFVGAPLSSVEYRVGEDGSLLVRGISAARYVIEDGKKKERDGWFDTRDLAEEQNGHYRILGRKDDVIVAADGENLNPALIEPRLDVPGVQGVCLVASGKEKKEPVLLASVPRYASAERLSEWQGALERRLNELRAGGRIRRIVFVGEPLLRDGEFKLNRARLAREYAAGALPVLDPQKRTEETVRDERMTALCQAFAAALDLPADQVGPETDFFTDGGGSSLEYFALLTRLQETFSVPIPTDAGLRTVRQIYDHVKAAEKHVD